MAALNANVLVVLLMGTKDLELFELFLGEYKVYN